MTTRIMIFVQVLTYTSILLLVSSTITTTILPIVNSFTIPITTTIQQQQQQSASKSTTTTTGFHSKKRSILSTSTRYDTFSTSSSFSTTGGGSGINININNNSFTNTASNTNESINNNNNFNIGTSPFSSRVRMSENSDITNDRLPTTFRQAEVLGLKYMQERKFEDALNAFKKGMTLPGSKADVLRTKSLAGPSPVGGSTGGFESKNTLSLDEFELQAANYNMACAYAQLNLINESIDSLQKAFQNGFDNYKTVRDDPDLDPIKNTKEFIKLMDTFEPKKGFNPFGLFGGKQ